MELWYENAYGDDLDLMNAREYALTAQTGLTSLPTNQISTVESVLTEGTRVMNARRSGRQITLTHRFAHDVRAARRNFVDTLDLQNPGRLRYRDNEIDVYAEVWVESCEVQNTDEGGTTATTSFQMPYPYFYSMEETVEVNAYLTPAWTFPFTFPVTFGSTAGTSDVNVYNNSRMPRGLVMTIENVATGTGTTVLHSITNQAGQGLFFVEGYQGVDMQRGDRLELCTEDGNKYLRVWDTSEGAYRNLVYRLDIDSEFFKLQPGENVVSVAVGTGDESNLKMTVTLRDVVKGV